MRNAIVLVVVLAGCQAPQPPATPPLPSTPPPPVAPPVVASANVSGLVLDARGMRVAHASVLVKPADASCHPIGIEAGAVTDESGEYLAVATLNQRQPYSGCVVVEANAGGASGSNAVRVEFTPDSPRIRADVRLDRIERLTATEAERLVRELAAAISDPARATSDLVPYILHGSEALRVALDQYRAILGRVTAIRTAPVESWEGHRFRFTLTGANGRETSVDVFQENLIRLHSGLLDYGFRSERFINAYLRAISSGDAEMLSRVMNPDDIDFPVEKAREMIVDYRTRFGDTSQIRGEFVDIDEKRNAIIWRLRGPAASEIIVLGFGDGLIGIRERRRE